MRKRPSIARVLVTDPELLRMDEPFGALDECTRNKLVSDLLALWRDRDLTVVFVTHSIYEAVFLSTHVAVMAARPGRISRIIDINHAGPRDETYRGNPRFAALCSESSEALRDASKQSGEMGRPAMKRSFANAAAPIEAFGPILVGPAVLSLWEVLCSAFDVPVPQAQRCLAWHPGQRRRPSGCDVGHAVDHADRFRVQP